MGHIEDVSGLAPYWCQRSETSEGRGLTLRYPVLARLVNWMLSLLDHFDSFGCVPGKTGVSVIEYDMINNHVRFKRLSLWCS